MSIGGSGNRGRCFGSGEGILVFPDVIPHFRVTCLHLSLNFAGAYCQLLNVKPLRANKQYERCKKKMKKKIR